MENREKASVGLNGVEGEKGMEKSGIGCEAFVRVLALVLTLTAAIVLGLNKQTKIVSVTIVPTLPPVDVLATAKFSYLSASVYSVTANSIACSHAAISLLILLLNRGKSKAAVLSLLAADLAVVALLFSATGAAGAVGLIGYLGNKHVLWKKVCGVFGKFCNQAAVSLVLSFLGSVAFLFLVVFDAMRLHVITL